MVEKRMFTREEFEQYRTDSASRMKQDIDLQQESLQVLHKADSYNWIHQANWMGEPILNLPQDLFALQEIIFKTRPDFIVEVGVAWGGSLLFYSTILEVLGHGEIIGVDIFIPDDLKGRLENHTTLAKRIHLITGSSIEQDTFDKVKSIISNTKNVMVILDSNHTHAHVYQELIYYSELVGKGNYLICGDTIIEDLIEPDHRPREWGPGNNPKTALDDFFKRNDRFSVDNDIDNKLLLTCNPGGYLKCTKD